MREQGGLQTVRQLVLGVVELGAFQRLCDESAQTGQDRPFVRRERVRLGVGQHTGADRPAGGDQRQVRPGRETVGGRSPRRIQPLQLLPGVEERGDAGGEGMGTRGLLGQRHAVELLHDLRILIAAVPEHMQPAGP